MPYTNVSRRAIASTHGAHSSRNDTDIDLVLAVMHCLLKPGECVSARTIAELTGLSHEGPRVILRSALKKCRHRIRQLKQEALT